MNCVKVIVTYIGDRPIRIPGKHIVQHGNHFQNHSGVDGVLALLRDVVQLERTIDPGLPMNTILVCNGGWPDKAASFIREINGSATYRGTLGVLSRENVGISFGGYAFAYKLWRDKYRFWLFTEDDVLFTSPGYALACREKLLKERLAFVGAFPPCDPSKLHCPGGVGLSRRAVLDRVAGQFGGELPYYHSEPEISSGPGKSFRHLPFVIHGEIPFTHCMVRLGMRLGDVPGIAECYRDYLVRSAR